MSEELWQVLNEPVEITLGEKKYKARLVPMKAVFAWAESRAVSAAIENIQKVAKGLEGKDKVAYLAEATRSAIPSGLELMEIAKTRLYSLEACEELLFQALHRDQPELARYDIKGMVVDNADGLDSLVTSLLVGGKKAEAQGKKPEEESPSNPLPNP